MPGLLTDPELEPLLPYLSSDGPRENGEWDMHCPLHDDANPSASLNVESATFYCNACEVGGPVGGLLHQQPRWVPREMNGNGNGYQRSRPGAETLSEARVEGWHDNLIRCEPEIRDRFMVARGLRMKTLKQFKIGWDGGKNAYTIPVYDRKKNLINVRRYVMDGDPTRRKIWSVMGHGTPTLFPFSQLRNQTIVICEGELDAFATIQRGFAAVTRTGSAGTWRREWTKLFRDKEIFICHDMDDAGQAANLKVARALVAVCKPRIIRLPYAVTEDHGKDLTDFWADYDETEFRCLMDEALYADDEMLDPIVINDANVMDASNPDLVGKPLRMTVTLRSRSSEEFSVVKDYRWTCPTDPEERCQGCPLKESLDNVLEGQIEKDERVLLSLQNSNDDQVEKIIKKATGIPAKCHMPFERTSYHSLTGYDGVPSLDHVSETLSGGEFKKVGITASGSHNLLAGQTVQMVGRSFPDPRTQANRFLASSMVQMETSLDNWELTDDRLELLRLFQAGKYAPLEKLRRIARSLSRHVTHIYGREELHMAMDLVFHSALKFKFDGQSLSRGWLELLVVGDTRTGKSEASQRLLHHFNGGQLVVGEGSTRAGIMGGAERMTDGTWGVSLGAIPMNDRRLVVLDEVTGLTPSDISAMSSMRSEGVMQITMIKAEKAWARTRAIWLSNPRDGKSMAGYKLGVDALRPVIGTDEDIARFDLAMTLKRGEVPAALINKSHTAKGDLRYTREACDARRQWAWSRREDQIVLTPEAEQACYEEAKLMDQKYVPDPPLVQIESIRIKLARIAVAMAACLFSTDATSQRVIVLEEHVRAAAEFIDLVYNMPGFGYGRASYLHMQDEQTAKDSMSECINFLLNQEPFVNFLANCGGHFKMVDCLEPFGDQKHEASNAIFRLSEFKMIEWHDGFQWIQPQLWEVLQRMGK